MSMNQNGGRTGGRGNGGRGRGRGRGPHDHHYRPPPPPSKKKNLDSNEDVPMLTFGSNTNFAVFKEKLGIAYLEKYGNL